MAATLIGHCFLLLWIISLLTSPTSAKLLSRRKSWNVIKEINQQGTSQSFHLNRMHSSLPKPSNLIQNTLSWIYQEIVVAGRRFKVGKIYDKKLIYVRCGVGMVNAAAATQQVLDLFDIIGIIHFGISGIVNDSMSIGDVLIPKQFINSGLWNWQNLNGTIDPSDIAHMEIGNYNVPNGEGINLLGHIGYSSEQFVSVSGNPNTAQPLFWMNTTHHWLELATNLEGMELERCVNSSFCLSWKPKLVIGLRGSTSNIFVDNAAYRDFLFQTFQVSSVDMESSAVVMTCLSNGFPVIVIRCLSDLAGAQSGKNPVDIYGPLAASNAAKVVLQFLKILSTKNDIGFND